MINKKQDFASIIYVDDPEIRTKPTSHDVTVINKHFVNIYSKYFEIESLCRIC